MAQTYDQAKQKADRTRANQNSVFSSGDFYNAGGIKTDRNKYIQGDIFTTNRDFEKLISSNIAVASMAQVTAVDLHNRQLTLSLFPKTENDIEETQVNAKALDYLWWKPFSSLNNDKYSEMLKDWNADRYASSPSNLAINVGAIVLVVFCDRESNSALLAKQQNDQRSRSVSSKKRLHTRNYGVVVGVITPASGWGL